MVLYIVVPCYNEEEVLPETSSRLFELLDGLLSAGEISEKSRVLFVDDGSRDHTWEIIDGLCGKTKMACGLKLSRNCGHQNALLAGMMTAKDLSDCVITLDADLQDDPSVIPEFLIKYKQGCDIVYGVRNSRPSDTKFKRSSARTYYSVMKKMDANIVPDHADYRLMSKRALDGLSRFGEENLFLRGIVPLIGFKSGFVYYKRNERFAGKSKYPLRKMIAFAVEGVTSFSVAPLKFITIVGFVIFILSIVCLIYALVSKITGNALAGWTTIIGSIWFIGGVQLLSLGICGEYIGKIYKETKKRPRYIIDTAIIK